MTALVASLGFLPMALSQGAGRGTKPLATVVIGGLLTAITHPLSITNPLYLVRKI
jgi:cobalt-zinc-cadmium resistance protein CzcA